MAEVNFQLRGWHALLAIPLLLGYLGFKMWLRVLPVDEAVNNAVREELLKEYSGRGPKDVARIVAEAREGLPVEHVKPVVQPDVEFTSLTSRGDSTARITLVRAEVTVDGGPPPDGRSVRYFRMSGGLTGGSMVIGESNAYFYFVEMWH
jgi:hypothetical protein